MIDKQNNKGVNLNRYETDVSGVSMKTLEAGLWWTKNRQMLKVMLIILLALIALASWAYTLYGFGYYLLVGMNSDNQLVTNLVQSTTVNQDFLNQRMAKDLVLSSPQYNANNGKDDLYVQVSNPNAKWWGTFDFCFSLPDGEKFCGNDFILPSDSKRVVDLAQSLSTSPNNLIFSITGLTWHKIDNHLIPDWNAYRADRLNLEIKNEAFAPAETNAVSEKIALNSLTFSVSDNSAYSFWEVPLSISLTNGSEVVYIDRYTISDLISFETRDVKITWPGQLGSVTGISVTPDLNILDQAVYQQPK